MDASAPIPAVRSLMVELALSFVGCGVALSRERYLSLVAGPCDTDRQIRALLCAVPGCAIVVRGLLRAIGCEHERLRSRYKDGRAALDIIEIAREADAWVDVRERGELLPSPGDLVVSVPANKVRHNYVVVECGGAEMPLSFLAVEGGHLDPRKHQQIIGTSARCWKATGEELLDVSRRIIRRVEGWCNLERLAKRWTGVNRCTRESGSHRVSLEALPPGPSPTE